MILTSTPGIPSMQTKAKGLIHCFLSTKVYWAPVTCLALEGTSHRIPAWCSSILLPSSNPSSLHSQLKTYSIPSVEKKTQKDPPTYLLSPTHLLPPGALEEASTSAKALCSGSYPSALLRGSIPASICPLPSITRLLPPRSSPSAYKHVLDACNLAFKPPLAPFLSLSLHAQFLSSPFTAELPEGAVQRHCRSSPRPTAAGFCPHCSRDGCVWLNPLSPLLSPDFSAPFNLVHCSPFLIKLPLLDLHSSTLCGCPRPTGCSPVSLAVSSSLSPGWIPGSPSLSVHPV